MPNRNRAKNRAFKVPALNLYRDTTKAYRDTSGALLRFLDSRMSASTRHFWIVVLAAKHFGSDAELIAEVTHLGRGVVQSTLSQLISLGVVKNGRVVPGYTNMITGTGNIRSIAGFRKRARPPAVRARIAA